VITLLAMLIFACNKHESEIDPIKPESKILKDTFYLVSRSGDTILTGRPVEVIKPFKSLHSSFKRYQQPNNLLFQYHEKSRNVLNPIWSKTDTQ